MVSKVIFMVATYIVGVIWGANTLINRALMESFHVFHTVYFLRYAVYAELC